MLLANDDYDAVLYPGAAYPETHPGRLAVMGLLHGLNPPPVDGCRVLEIGCNDAANLIPMAYAMPGADFTGFDLAALPIARARQRIADLSLTNIRVFQGDLMEIADLGLEPSGYDYIIAHGVYAWIPEAARDSLLALCRRYLAENGIAYVSYNALPGGHIRNLVADILLQTIPYAEELRSTTRRGPSAMPSSSWTLSSGRVPRAIRTAPSLRRKPNRFDARGHRPFTTMR